MSNITIRPRIPVCTCLAFLLTISGTGVFGYHILGGMADMADIAANFPGMDLLPFFELGHTALLSTVIVISILSFAITAVSFLQTTTLHTRTFRTKVSSENTDTPIVGSRICIFALFVNYVMFYVGIGLFALTIALITFHLSFQPLCLKETGWSRRMCLNFTKMGIEMSNALKNDPRGIVNLSLCGHTISQFCRLGAVFGPWCLGSLVGAFLILVGLHHFTACLSGSLAKSRGKTPQSISNRNSSYDVPPVMPPSEKYLPSKMEKKRVSSVFFDRSPPGYVANVVDPDDLRWSPAHLRRQTLPNPTIV